MRRHPVSCLFIVALPLLLPGAGAVAGKAPAAPAAFVPLRAERDGSIPKPARDEALNALSRQGPPDHVVILVHGFDTPYFASTEQYEQIAAPLQEDFRKLGQRVGVIGLQWPSNAGAMRDWLPKSFAHITLRTIGFRNAVRDPYLSKVPIARSVGRVGLRQIIFDLQERYPASRIHLIGHSMGTEVIAQALDPEITKVGPRGPQPYEPARACDVGLLCLAGSDLDYDAIKKAPQRTTATGSASLVWVTYPKLGAREDQVLRLRKIPRGKPAFGDRVPMLRGQQYDTAVGNRRLVYDSDAIPPNHEILKYLSPHRLEELAEAAVTVGNPSQQASPVLRDLDAILRAPAEPAALAAYLDHPEASAKLYALWRLEQLCCGDSRHMVSGYSLRVLRKGKDSAWLEQERARTECKVVKEGYWPPRGYLATAARGARAAPRPAAVHQGFYTQPYPTVPPAVGQ